MGCIFPKIRNSIDIENDKQFIISQSQVKLGINGVNSVMYAN